MITVFVYRLDDGTTQVRCQDTSDADLVVDMLEDAILAITDGEKAFDDLIAAYNKGRNK